MTDKTIQKLLVANRGEIALRIMRTARKMGIRTIAVYSEADSSAPFVRAADESVCIGPAEAAKSYLNQDVILNVARDYGADALHPGYGFLSENARLAEACEEMGVHFVGPPGSAISEMGSKSAAKSLFGNAGVPLIPGYHGDEQSDSTLIGAAEEIGYPLLIKASAGGGGKGMRVVRQASELEEALQSARREAESGFGDPHLLLERFLDNPRHVEVQVLFDQHGQGRYLFDRDCSVQRRHQKIIEEAPAPGLSEATRQAMGEAAVRCGEAIGYTGAGTVEFLYEPGGHFYFMEMNTRLQVEHPVTEMITGTDLVEWQIRVAQGEHLNFEQADLTHQGHAMEARIYAEDPEQDFMPATGRIHFLHEPTDQEHVRVDSGVEQGLEITPWYDPMLAKVIAWGTTRDEARKRLSEALMSYRAQGVTLNTAFVRQVLEHPAFADARLSTHFLDQYPETLTQQAFSREEQQVLSWLGWYLAGRNPLSDDPWSEPSGFRLAGQARQSCELRLGGEDTSLEYEVQSRDSATVKLRDSEPLRLRWQPTADREAHAYLNGRCITLSWASHGERLGVFADACHWDALVNHPEEQNAESEHDGILTAPMHGRITGVPAHAGAQVEAGAPLVIMEAMKMEHTLRAPSAGTVSEIHCEQDDSVAAGQELVIFEAEEAST